MKTDIEKDKIKILRLSFHCLKDKEKQKHKLLLENKKKKKKKKERG
jgi:hypothetical protein